MRSPLWLLAILIITLFAGCSRQPTPHLGEWIGEWFLVGDEVLYKADFVFLADGRVQKIRGEIKEQPLPNIVRDSPPVQEGRYKFDYSKNPIHLDIQWEDNVTLRGIVRYVGEDKNRMQIIYSSYYPERPTNFELKEPSWRLTKKVKK